MTRLFYNDTVYGDECPVDISPLILQLYRKEKVLALCAREGMVQRIKALPEEATFGCQVDVVGWWELDSERYSDLLVALSGYGAVVIVGRERIDQSFLGVLEHFEALFREEGHTAFVKSNRRLMAD